MRGTWCTIISHTEAFFTAVMGSRPYTLSTAGAQTYEVAPAHRLAAEPAPAHVWQVRLHIVAYINALLPQFTEGLLSTSSQSI
jgi:hypothetical protein